MKFGKKQFSIKALGAGADVTAEQLGKINGLAMVELTADAVYVRRFLLAHNCIDRDRERFNEALLDDFARTLPRKGLLWGHQWGPPGKGLFFDATTEEMTPEAFSALTGETPQLPPDTSMVKVLWGWAYMLKIAENEGVVANLDGGVYRHVSIGFKAESRVPVTDQHGNVLFEEYKPKGEAIEGSLVLLGAQPGATAQKALDIDEASDAHISAPNDKGGSTSMKWLKMIAAKLGKPDLTEETAGDAIAAALDAKDATITELTQKAADGEAYRKSLVDDCLKFGRLLKEMPDDEEGTKKKTEFIGTWPIAEVKTLRDSLEGRARKEFPTEFQLPGKAEDDRQEGTAAQVSAETKKKYALVAGA